MLINTNVSKDGSVLTIGIQGRFDISSYEMFMSAYENMGQSMRTYEVDMRETSYLDSSALGMLLLLRDHAGKNSTIKILNCNDNIRKVLSITNFEKLFDMQ